VAQHVIRALLSIAGVAAVTFVAYNVLPVNALTAGFGYFLCVLFIASTWSFIEASLASVASTLALNYFFLPPIKTFTISDPQNWIALFSFLMTSLVTSRLSAKAERRALDALDRKHEVERLYSFSRAILLINEGEPFAKQLAGKLADIFELSAVVLYERRSGEIHRTGPADFQGMDDQLRDAAQHGTSFSDTARNRVITAVRLGSEPIASLALQGSRMPDSVVQGIANLVAIGLERARAQDLSHQIEAARRTEELRTALIDAMAHEFKTPLTSIRAATSSLLENPGQPAEGRTELLKIADEEAEHLTKLIDDAVEMARLDSPHIDLSREKSDICEIVREVVESMRTAIDERPLEVDCGRLGHTLWVDRRLLKLAVKQLLENALKYSPPGSPVKIRVFEKDNSVSLDISNGGNGITPEEQSRIFERFYRIPSVKKQIPGSGLGLSIARSIARAHGGDLTVASRPGETTFTMSLPTKQEEQSG
jgi:two-component system sensor histidine kinase KdpD